MKPVQHVNGYDRNKPARPLAFYWKTSQLRKEVDAKTERALADAGFYEAIEELVTDEFMIHGGLV